MSSVALERYITKHGVDATLYEFTPQADDSWGDPGGWNETTTPTTAIVELARWPKQTLDISGEMVTIDATIYIPSSVTISPTATERRPELEISGVRYKIWMVDTFVLAGGQRLYVSRKES